MVQPTIAMPPQPVLEIVEAELRLSGEVAVVSDYGKRVGD